MSTPTPYFDSIDLVESVVEGYRKYANKPDTFRRLASACQYLLHPTADRPHNVTRGYYQQLVEVAYTLARARGLCKEHGAYKDTAPMTLTLMALDCTQDEIARVWGFVPNTIVHARSTVLAKASRDAEFRTRFFDALRELRTWIDDNPPVTYGD